MCIVSVHGADYLITIGVFYNSLAGAVKQYGRGGAACAIMRQATFYMSKNSDNHFADNLKS